MQNIIDKFLYWLYAPRQVRALYEIGPLLRELFSLDGLKRAGIILLTLIEICGVVILDSSRTPRGPKLDLTGYSVVFEDEFDGTALDLDKWEYRGSGKRSGGFMHPDQVRLEDGKLILKAEYKEDAAYGPGWYAGMIRTKDEFVRGYFEMTCIVSYGGGFSSSWWLNSDGMASAALSQGGVGGAEVDIFEAFNYKKTFGKDSVSINIHVDGYGPDIQSTQLGSWRGKNIYNQYNTYGLLWSEEEYIFYINGVEAVRSSFKDGVSQAPEYPIISLELPDASEFSKDLGFTTEFMIESVRIWQKD